MDREPLETLRERADALREVADHVEARLENAYDSFADRVGARVEEAVEHLPPNAKPHLRGWLHLGAFPVSLVLGIILVVLSDPGSERVSTAIYAATSALLFGISALYHRGNWSPRTKDLLKRFDHANIFLIIAGTYTPLTVVLLTGSSQTTLLWVVWVAAFAGVIFRVTWPHAPRWLIVPAYAGLGWAAVFYLGDFLSAGGVAVFTLIAVGGVLYTLGGIVYATKRPDPSPRWFGFHEVFHTLTLLAWTCHYIAISLAVYTHP